MRQWLPAKTIVEIAPGHGRWTQFLQPQAETLHIVDLSDDCIARCKERFAAADNIHYHVNDGKTLPATIADGSVDFVYSFDSLVHCEIAVIEAYFMEIGKKLAPGGTAFIHHSNLGHYPLYFKLAKMIPAGRQTLGKMRIVDYDCWRGVTVSPETVAAAAAKAGLEIHCQELVNWWAETRRCIDGITTLRKPLAGATPSAPPAPWFNASFMTEARVIREREEHYPAG
ncbi:class I SAM-dependent methyltransferase [Luteolibacter sp. LG18]|uniref:class I SAM-dependent methyltransferase n=1 Tax=Luteolibacter sp. LG18 TaxID=2819286 RepID=UPI0030C70C03